MAPNHAFLGWPPDSGGGAFTTEDIAIINTMAMLAIIAIV